jgi:hypothetical protein
LVQCFDAYLVSATYGTQDLAAHPDVVISSGSALPFEIVSAHGGGTVTAKVESAPKPGAMILLFPQGGGDPIASVDDRSNEFEFRNVAPGAYVAYAFSNIEDVEYRNPEFIRTLTGGVPVQVEDGKAQKITIPGVTQ